MSSICFSDIQQTSVLRLISYTCDKKKKKDTESKVKEEIFKNSNRAFNLFFPVQIQHEQITNRTSQCPHPEVPGCRHKHNEVLHNSELYNIWGPF